MPCNEDSVTKINVPYILVVPRGLEPRFPA
jgi:hypothetical protein